MARTKDWTLLQEPVGTTVLGLGLAFCIFLSGIVSIAAGSAPLILEVFPEGLKLGRSVGEERRLLVVASGAGEMPVASASLAIVPTYDLRVRVVAAPEQFPSTGDLVWTLAVSAGPASLAEAEISFRLDYQMQASAGSEAPNRTSVLTSKIVVAAPLDPSASAQIELKLAPTPLHEADGAAHPAYLVIKNVAIDPLTVSSVEVALPTSLSFSKVETPVTIAPGQRGVIGLSLQLSDSFVSGEQPLILKVLLVQETPTGPREGVAVVEQTITLGVAGLSESLKLIQVPSFLLVPGALVLLVCSLIWTWLPPKRTEDFPLKLSSPESWVVAITISIAAAFLYPTVTEWFGERRSYLTRYGLRDVINVWLGALVAAIPLYALASMSLRGWQSLANTMKQSRHARRTPTREDTPLDILEKLARQKCGFVLDQATYSTNGSSIVALQLDFGDAPDGKAWITSPATYVQGPNFPGEPLQETLRIALAMSEATKELLKILRRAVNKRELVVSWQRRGLLQGPLEVEMSKLTANDQKQSLIGPA